MTNEEMLKLCYPPYSRDNYKEAQNCIIDAMKSYQKSIKFAEGEEGAGFPLTQQTITKLMEDGFSVRSYVMDGRFISRVTWINN